MRAVSLARVLASFVWMPFPLLAQTMTTKTGYSLTTMNMGGQTIPRSRPSARIGVGPTIGARIGATVSAIHALVLAAISLGLHEVLLATALPTCPRRGMTESAAPVAAADTKPAAVTSWQCGAM